MGLAVPDHVGCSRRALVESGRPVLYAQVGPEVRVEDVDHITGREHVGVTSGQVLVDDDPVAGLQAGCLGQLGVGNDTRPDDDRLGVDRAGIG